MKTNIWSTDLPNFYTLMFFVKTMLLNKVFHYVKGAKSYRTTKWSSLIRLSCSKYLHLRATASLFFVYLMMIGLTIRTSNVHINGSEFGDKGNIKNQGLQKWWRARSTKGNRNFTGGSGKTIGGLTVFLTTDIDGDKTRGVGTLLLYFTTRTENASLLCWSWLGPGLSSDLSQWCHC